MDFSCRGEQEDNGTVSATSETAGPEEDRRLYLTGVQRTLGGQYLHHITAPPSLSLLSASVFTPLYLHRRPHNQTSFTMHQMPSSFPSLHHLYPPSQIFFASDFICCRGFEGVAMRHARLTTCCHHPAAPQSQTVCLQSCESHRWRNHHIT